MYAYDPMSNIIYSEWLDLSISNVLLHKNALCNVLVQKKKNNKKPKVNVQETVVSLVYKSQLKSTKAVMLPIERPVISTHFVL